MARFLGRDIIVHREGGADVYTPPRLSGGDPIHLQLTKLRNNGHYVGLRKLETEDPSLKDITNSKEVKPLKVKPLKVKEDSLEAEMGVEQSSVEEDSMKTLVADAEE